MYIHWKAREQLPRRKGFGSFFFFPPVYLPVVVAAVVVAAAAGPQQHGRWAACGW